VAAAGAAAAIALTLFNAVQPSLGTRRVHPGTVRDVALTLTAAAAGPVATAPAGAAARPASTIAEPRATRPAAAAKPAAARAAVSQSIPVGKARFVGFSWPNPDAARQGAAASGAGRVWLRTRTAAGWSVAWSELETVAEGPDATSPEYHPERTYTDGLWLPAGTKEVQVRVDGAAGGPGTDDLAAHLVTPDMTPTPTGDAGGPSQAVAMTSQPAIISRARWGADERARRAAPSYSGTVKAAFVHHTVQSNGYSPSESAALVRADYLYHVRKRGWNDIGYNFLVDRFGRVFEGRYGGVTRPVLGAHAGGFNTDTTGVAMLGTFSSRRPPAAMRAAMQRLLAWKLDLTHVDPRGQVTLTSRGGANVRYPAGRRVRVPTILGHRSTSYTDCPGGPTIALLPTIRAAVARTGLPKIYGGTASRSWVAPGRSGPVNISARFSPVASWRLRVVGSNGAGARGAWSGRGTRVAVAWNGRAISGAPAPAGWATMTLTASVGGRSARPATIRVYVDRLPPRSGSSTGGFANGVWSVSNVNAEQRSSSSTVFARYRWGVAGDTPVVGDWDGNGSQTLGVVRGRGLWYLRNSVSGSPAAVAAFRFGQQPGDRWVVGDWDGDGDWTPGVVRNGTWLLRNSNSAGPVDVTFQFGAAGDRYLAGDWDGDRRFGPGLYRNGTFRFRNALTSGPSDLQVSFGRAGDRAFVGDWDGDGDWTPGVLRSGVQWYLKDSFSGGAASAGLRKQTAGTPVVGDWDNRP
jgi:hypothetical protein